MTIVAVALVLIVLTLVGLSPGPRGHHKPPSKADSDAFLARLAKYGPPRKP